MLLFSTFTHKYYSLYRVIVVESSYCVWVHRLWFGQQSCAIYKYGSVKAPQHRLEKVFRSSRKYLWKWVCTFIRGRDRSQELQLRSHQQSQTCSFAASMTLWNNAIKLDLTTVHITSLTPTDSRCKVVGLLATVIESDIRLCWSWCRGSLRPCMREVSSVPETEKRPIQRQVLNW